MCCAFATCLAITACSKSIGELIDALRFGATRVCEAACEANRQNGGVTQAGLRKTPKKDRAPINVAAQTSPALWAVLGRQNILVIGGILWVKLAHLCHSTASESHLEHEPVELVKVVELYSESSRPLLAPKLQ